MGENKYAFNEKRFNNVLKESKINKDKLLSLILSKLEESEKFENEKGNFGKMIKGTRGWKAEYVGLTEKILKRPFTYFIQSDSDDNSMIKYECHGIEYTVSTDKYDKYKELFAERDSDGKCIAGNYDEYNNTIMDYILQYHSLNGVRYLIENDIIKFSVFTSCITSNNVKYNIDLIDENQVLGFINLVFEINDFDLFERFMNLKQIYQYVDKERSLLYKKDFLRKMLKSFEIMKKIMMGGYELDVKEANPNLVSSGYSYSKLKFANPLMNELLRVAIEDENYDILRDIVNEGIELNFEIRSIIHSIPNIELSDLRVDENGYVIHGHFTKLGLVVRYNEILNPELPDEIKEELIRLNKSADEILVSDFNLAGNKIYKATVINDGKRILKPSTNNEVEYEMLKYMEQKNFSLVPKYYGSKEGVDTFDNFVGHKIHCFRKVDDKCFRELLSFLKRFQNLSRAKLENKVYVHHELSCNDLVFDDNENLIGVENWDKCTVGEAYEDLMYIIYSYSGIREPLRDKRTKLDNIRFIVDLLEPGDEIKKSLGSLLKAYLIEMQKNLDKMNSNYENRYLEIGNCMVFVDLYMDVLNNL